MSAPALAMTLDVPAVWHEVASREEWEHWFAQVPRPHFPQSWAYGEGKRAEGWGVRRLVCRDRSGPIALCQLLGRRPLGIAVTRINRGPLLLDAHPPAERLQQVFRSLRDRWRWGCQGLLLIAPGLPETPGSHQLLRETGFRCRRAHGWHSSLLDLQLPDDELFAKLAPDWRTKIRRAVRLGVSLQVRRDAQGIEWLLERHVENMRAKRFRGPGPDFVRAVTRAAPEDFWLLQALVDGRPEAGLLIGRVGGHAENFIAWFSDAARRATAGNFLMWHAVLEMKRAGCRTLDLGGFSVADRYGHFKRGMRGQEYQLAGEWLAF